MADMHGQAMASLFLHLSIHSPPGSGSYYIYRRFAGRLYFQYGGDRMYSKNAYLELKELSKVYFLGLEVVQAIQERLE